jgi:hypothetical protein
MRSVRRENLFPVGAARRAVHLTGLPHQRKASRKILPVRQVGAKPLFSAGDRRQRIGTLYIAAYSVLAPGII